jgi:hypothetical protein
LLKITRRLSTAFAPETDRSTERMNQNVEVFICSFVDHDQKTWAKLLACAELASNNREASAIGVNLFFLMHDYHVEPIQIDEETLHKNEKAVSPIQKADNIIKKLKDAQDVAQSVTVVAQQMIEAQANRKRVQSPEFREKDKVWSNLANIRTNRLSKKLDAKHAKYTVIELIGSHACRLDTPPGVHNVFNNKLLRLAANDPLPSQVQDDSQPPPVLIRNEEKYEVGSYTR